MEDWENADEKLREAASNGDKNMLNRLIREGAEINSQNKMNGWTALHWAAKRGHLNLVCILLEHRAETSIKNFLGETAADVAFNESIRKLINSGYYNTSSRYLALEKYVQTETCPVYGTTFKSDISTISNASNFQELVLKIRMENDSDFIEVELNLGNLTFQSLVRLCCLEMNINSDDIFKIRKLPNTIIRKDKDVKRLHQFQELEIIPKRFV